MGIILGLDPGTRRCGFGLVETRGSDLVHIDHGVIHLDESWSLGRRLCRLESELRRLHAEFVIDHVAIEKIFFGKNADSAFKLGHARGVCMMVAARHQAEIAEYAASFVKKSVTGNGAAEKEHVRMIVFNLLRVPDRGLSRESTLDASDALALAIAHARTSDAREVVARAMGGAR